MEDSTPVKKRNNICFAYFGDDKFVGWYSDTFGSITKNSPKVYGLSEQQIETITSGFRHKLSKVNKVSSLAESSGLPALGLMDSGLNSDSEKLSKYKQVELRVVECPIYDGPNPDFDKDAYDKLVQERKDKMIAEGIFDIPGPSRERTLAVEEFNERNPHPARNNWIYCDYSKVKEWASVEPTEFIGRIN